MKPNFLGIGVPRGGSSWLHRLVGAHPDAFTSAAKELRFFDQNFANGWADYERHFPPDDERDRWIAVGECTPFYLYCPEALERIRKVPEIRRFLVILRDPVERLRSHHAWAMLHRGEDASLEDFVRRTPDAIRWSLYAEPIERWLDAVGPERLLVLEHDEATGDPVAARTAVARHLGLDPERFPADAGCRRVNESFSPRFPAAFRVASVTAMRLRRHGLGAVSRFAVDRLGAKTWFGRREAGRSEASANDLDRLAERFAADIDRLERVLGRSFDAWRRPARKDR